LNINLNKKNNENSHGYTLTRDLSPLRENINHHLSNKEIGIISIFKKKKDFFINKIILLESLNNNHDNDKENNKTSSSSSSSAASAFQRLLFFKKPSATKQQQQHSSLKRAKSGIQLDRKKYSSTIGSPGTLQPPATPTLSSSSTTSTAIKTNNENKSR
jgi:hypothetical protein